ncbi:hypothetical protein DDE18_05965 [Nocardioides gansuensis]|uniref:Uncharacterized protein n=1 Tax=Nocardioides gansuensis TaxID=2138300 RepID=A0A2T8FDR3_9ACTN|nr:hypothetical protein [Nocardioides gansuensis]PVG83847.1 hypothetical protein DDE18_05965 [Nocardioides gansuensis]
MYPELPRSARLAWWATAWLRGHEPADHVLDAMAELEEAHSVVGLEGGGGLVDLLASWRRAGATGVGLALPVEGDPVGLGGPRAFNDAALEAGEGVVAAGVGAVPELVGEVVHWTVLPADRRQLADVGEADRGLRSALVEAADELAALDVARWRPEAADALMDLHHRPALDAPLGTPPRCVELAARGLQAWAIVDLALEDDGGAVSAYEIGRRRDSMQPLERAARRAVVAACSPEVWPH